MMRNPSPTSSIAVRSLLCLAVTLAASGCASKAVRPPTPAAQLDTLELLSRPVPQGERYYLILFGSETIIRHPSAVHTWATMVRVVDDPNGGPAAVEPNTISWGPASHKTRPWSFSVEPGSNGDLHGTIKEMYDFNEHITMWGPYEVWYGNYIRFMTQKAFMESGQVGYQCIDNIGEAAKTGRGCDCIHSISDMDPMFDRKGYSLIYYGVPATRNIVKQIMTRPVIINAPHTHDWLIPALGLDGYPIQREFYSGEVVSFSPQKLREALEQGSTGSTRNILAFFGGSQ